MARPTIAPLLSLLLALAACEAEEEPPPSSKSNVSKAPEDVPAGITAVSGRVLDGATMDPIQGAVVTTDPPTGSILTNSLGQWVLDATDFPKLAKQVGLSMRVAFDKTGYVSNTIPITVVEGHFQGADVLLSKSAQAFDLELSHSLLEFRETDFAAGAAKATKQINVRLTSTATVPSTDFSVNVPPVAAQWLEVQPSVGTAAHTPTFVNVTVDRSTLEAGLHTVLVSFVDTGASGIEVLQVIAYGPKNR